MGGLILLYLWGRDGDRRSEEDEGLIWLLFMLLLLPLVITVSAPYLWWTFARDAGHGWRDSVNFAAGPIALAVAGGLWVGWWAVPLVLFLDGLAGLFLVSWINRTRRKEEAD